MTTHQMNTELVQLMKRTVDRFNISSETYYHAVLLFNVIQLKTNSEAQPEYFTIPIRKRELCWDSESDSDYENDCLPEPSTQYVTLHHSEMPEKDKLYLTVCLFLVHKLYEPYPLCLLYLMRQLSIEERFEEYIISLEKEFLVRLAYKIQNMLPSNETIFACHLWDQFTQNISSTCIDIRFGIRELFQCSKKQIKTAHLIDKANIHPQFKTIQNKSSFQALSKNIQILVHNRAVYELYIKNSLHQNHQEIPSMKKIGLAITYVTIQQQTHMIFTKRYQFGQQQNSTSKHKKNQYLEFVFNDFLQQHFEIDLNHLSRQIQVINSILEHSGEIQYEGCPKNNTTICSIKNLEVSKSNQFVSFLLRVLEKPTLRQYNHKYHQKGKGNISISSTKTENQLEAIQSYCTKTKCHSILGKSVARKNRNLQSTLHQSNISDKASSLSESIQVLQSGLSRQKDLAGGQTTYIKQIKSVQQFDSADQRCSKALTLKKSSNRHGNSSIDSNHQKQVHQAHYKVSQFVSTDV